MKGFRKAVTLQQAMDPVTKIFTDNIVTVYFFYGLAFFSMGLVVWLESGRTSKFRIARAIGPLAGFGIIHGLHEWFEMFQVLSQSEVTNIPEWLLLEQVRIPHLVVSFLLLILFGVRLLYVIHRKDGNEQKFAFLAVGALFIVWLASVFVTRWLYQPNQDQFVDSVDVLARYILGIPGALLAAWAIILEQRSFKARGMAGFGRDLLWAAWALILYGVVGQAFTRESFLFPSNTVNDQLFQNVFGFPVQFFRATQSVLIAIFVIRALRAFDLERKQRLNQANLARIAAQKEALATQRRAQTEAEQLNDELLQREELLGQLLHQIVSAQEGERQRIARELHDGAGQTLTGLGLGLAAAGESVKSDPVHAIEQLTELKRLNALALEELHNIIADLRPSVLDDLGLVAAFHAQSREFEARTGVKANFVVEGKRRRLSPDIEMIIFRIAQEALTNVAKHAEAQTVTIVLRFDDTCLGLQVRDDGRGFDTDAALRPNQHRQAWGLLGIQERVSLVGGNCRIASQPGLGTTIQAELPLTDEEVADVENQFDFS